MTPSNPPVPPESPDVPRGSSPAAVDAPFDAAFWKSVNAALDEALECDEISRPAFVKRLHSRDPRIALEVRKLLGRAHAQTLATNVVRHPTTRQTEGRTDGLTTQLAPILGDAGERGFDQLLQRALRAERSRVKDTRHAGELCGTWRLQEVIGVGGMGEVWLAERADGLYHAKVAVKFLRTDGDTESFEARFAQERALLARLNHPGIARLIDAGRLFGQPFLVLEHVDGQPLLNYAAEHASTVESRIELIREIGEAVSYAHSQLVVHRDLKPSNILVTPGGHAKLLDFGVAGLLDDAEHDEATTSEATKMGGRGLTVEYAAPEQISGEATGVASDIYSLGSLAYHLLSGRRAHLPEKPGRAALEYAVLHVTPERLSHAATHHDHATAKDNIPPPANVERLEGDIDAIISRAIRIDASDRYRTMEAFVADLTRWVQRRPISARREDRSYRTRLWLRRNWLPVSLTASVFIALVPGLALSIWQYDRARTEAARANKTADYLVELLGRADPDLHGGKWPSALDLLDEAARDTRTRFKDEPATEERLARLFATTYRSLSRDNDALPLARRAYALSAQLHGENALATLRARSLLAWVLYWSDDFKAAVENMKPVMEQLPQHLAAKSAEMLDAKQRYANILAGVYRIAESEALFREVITDYQGLGDGAPDRAWRIADAEGDLASAFTRAGRWQDALELLRRNAAQYAAPPANDLKTALSHQGDLITVQNILGDPRGVETQIIALIARWRQLAGEKNERIDELLNDLGLYYVQSGQANEAEQIYLQLQTRAAERVVPSVSDQLRTAIDLVEVRARFGRGSSAELIDESERIADGVSKDVAPVHTRFRQLLLRAAFAALTLGRTDLAERYAEIAKAGGTDQSATNDVRADAVRAGIARANGRHAEALALIEKRLQILEGRGEKVSLRRAFVQIDHAYGTWLAGGHAASGQVLQSLDRVRLAMPANVPANHRVYRQMNYVSALVRFGADSPEFRAARDALAKDFGKTGATLPEVLLGLYVAS